MCTLYANYTSLLPWTKYEKKKTNNNTNILSEHMAHFQRLSVETDVYFEPDGRY